MQAGEKRLQQDDNYKEFLGWLTDGGLRYAYAKYTGEHDPQTWYRQKVKKDKRKHVIIVGAGVGGLSAAYELAQVGHKVTILEARTNVGGRILTIKDGLTDGQFAEAGAMRIPHNHFLTKNYVDKFHIKTIPFQYYNEEGYIYVKGEKVKQKEWKRNNGYYCDKWWPGWDSNLTSKTKQELNIDGVVDLFKATIAPIIAELGDTPSESTWHTWVEKWSPISLEDFLRSEFNQDPGQPKLRPWPEPAIEAYKVSTYTVMMSFSLLAYLRNELGRWWSDPMTVMAEGMDCLPKAFTEKNVYGWNTDVELSKNIEFGVMVQRVTENDAGVQVTGVKKGSNTRVDYNGDAVILTLPLQILRQLNLPFSYEKKRVLSRIIVDSATKIALQCKTQFWQKDVGQGGFTKTDLPIGHFVYPGWKGSGIDASERGVLLVYMRHKQALSFGSMPRDISTRDAINQIAEIHPDILREIEACRIHAWNSYPYAQGAFSAFYPKDYMVSMKTMATPTERVYVASDTMSWAQSCCSWIQGSVFSSLMQAFCFIYHNEAAKILCPVHLLYTPEMDGEVKTETENLRQTSAHFNGVLSKL